MKTEPGIIPCSYSSSSRTSRNVRVAEARLGGLGIDLGDALLRRGEQLAEGGHGCCLPVGRKSGVRNALPQRSGIPQGSSSRRRIRRPSRVANAASDLAARAGSTSPSWSRLTASATPSNGVGWAFTITRRAPLASATRAARRRGTRRARSRARGTRRRRGRSPLRPVQVLGHEVLAEADRRRLQDPAAVEARGIRLARTDPVERLAHRAAPPARHALHLAHVAVDLDDLLGRRPRRVVQAVDVLGHERVQAGAPLELGERDVAGVGLGVPHAARQPVLPRRAADARGRRGSTGSSRSSRRRDSSSRRPCGPRKSGMPDSVEMPAPVRTTICVGSRQPQTSSRSKSMSGSIARDVMASASGMSDARTGVAGREPSPGRPHPARAGSGGGGWEQTGFPRGFAVAFPRPAVASWQTAGWNPQEKQRVLDVVVTFALLEQRQGEPPGTTTRGRDGRLVEPGIGPVGVVDLEVRREAAHVALLHRREAAAHGDGAAAVAARELELLEPRRGCGRSASCCRSSRRARALATSPRPGARSIRRAGVRTGRRDGGAGGGRSGRASGARTSRRSASAGRSRWCRGPGRARA